MSRVMAIVTNPLPAGTDRATAMQMFCDSIPRYMTEKYGHPAEVACYQMPITMARQHDTVYDESTVGSAHAQAARRDGNEHGALAPLAQPLEPEQR
jgi:hypothetical protein